MADRKPSKTDVLIGLTERLLVKVGQLEEVVARQRVELIALQEEVREKRTIHLKLSGAGMDKMLRGCV